MSLTKFNSASLAIDPLLLRTYPSSQEAEKGILGAILLDNSLAQTYVAILHNNDFFYNPHRIIFESIVRLVNTNSNIDIITLENDLQKRGLLEECGGIQTLVLLQENISVVGYIEKYIEIVKEKSILREVITMSSSLMKQCYSHNDEGVSSVIDAAEKMLFEIANRQTKKGFIQLDLWLKKAFESLVVPTSSFKGITGVPSGFFMLDELTSGFQKGDLIVIAARPGMGKTAFALCIAKNSAFNNFPVGIVSLEMSADQLVFRILAFDSGVRLSSLRSGNITSHDWLSITNSAARLANTKIFIDDSPGQTILDIRTKARKLKIEHNIKLLVIDYLQLLNTYKKHESRHHEVSEISRFLKCLAKELDIPIIALSQLSRGVESRVEKRPLLSDLRDSGAIEQDADLILFLYRESEYRPDTENPDQAEVIIGKHRNGPTGKVILRYVKEITLFEDMIAD